MSILRVIKILSVSLLRVMNILSESIRVMKVISVLQANKEQGGPLCVKLYSPLHTLGADLGSLYSIFVFKLGRCQFLVM